MKTVKVEIHQDKDHAWCEIDGSFIYAKDADELQQTLASMSEYNKQQYEIAQASEAAVSCNYNA